MMGQRQVFATGQLVSGLLVVAVGFAVAVEAVKDGGTWAMIFAWAVIFKGTYLVLDILAPGA